MSRQTDIHQMLGRRISVGLSTIIGVTVVAGQLAQAIKYFSGGSLEIGCTSGGGWGTAYLMGTSEVVNVDNAGTFYLAATGATAIAHMITAKSQGYDI